MSRRLFFTILLLAFVQGATAQKALDSVYLLRRPDKHQDFIQIPNTGAYFIQKAGLKSHHFGWQLPDEFVPSDSDMLYFEMNSTDVPAGPWSDYTGGSFQFIIDLPRGIAALNLDTVGRLGYHLINNYADRGPNQADNQLSGILQFQYRPGESVVITGIIDIRTTRPYETRQQVVYSDVAFPVMSLKMYENAEAEKQARQQQEEQSTETLDAAIGREKQVFSDSLFTREMAKRCSLIGVWDYKQKFNYRLTESFILSGAVLGRRPQGSLTDMIGHNFLDVSSGRNMVILLHSLDDPDHYSIDDETNYSLGIELSGLFPGKTVMFHQADATPAAILGYWHWGPGGHPVLSEKVKGSVTILANTGGLVSGKIDLTFYFGKTSVRITGNFLLQTVSLTAVRGFQAQLVQKYGRESGR